MKTLYQLLLDRWNQNCDTVLVTIVEGNGSIPRTTGAYMAADQTGRIYGTACLQADQRAACGEKGF